MEELALLRCQLTYDIYYRNAHGVSSRLLDRVERFTEDLENISDVFIRGVLHCL